MMRRGCNRKCWPLESREWFTRIRRSSISRHQEGKCSGSSRAKRSNAHERIENLSRTDLARFPGWTGAASGTTGDALTTRIYNSRAQPLAPGGVSEAGQRLCCSRLGATATFQGKSGSCSLSRAFTPKASIHLVIWLKVRQNQPQGSNFCLKVLINNEPSSLSCSGSGKGEASDGNLSCIFSTEKYP